MAFHIPGKVSGTYRHRLHGLPRIPLPGHTRKITFVTIMSTYKFSLCRLELVVCRDFIFDSIQGEFILLYTKQEIQSFSDEFIYSRMKELLSSPLCRDIPESEQVDCLFCLERYDCANSIPPEFFQLNDEFQRRRSNYRQNNIALLSAPLLYGLWSNRWYADSSLVRAEPPYPSYRFKSVFGTTIWLRRC